MTFMSVHALFDKGKKRDIRNDIKAGRVVARGRFASQAPEEEPTVIAPVQPPAQRPAPAVAPAPVQQPLIQPPPLPPPVVRLPVPAPQPQQAAGPKNIDVELMKAVTKGDETQVESLLKQGANPNMIIGKRGLAHTASGFGFVGILRLLRRYKCDIDCGDENGMTPLHHAVRRKQPGSLIALIGMDAKLDKQDCKGLTALHHAVLKEEPFLAKLLAEAGADVNTCQKDDLMTPIMSAIFADTLNRKTELTRAVLLGDVDFEARDIGGRNALIHAIDSKKFSLLKLVLDAGASPNSLGPGDLTAFKYARKHGTLPMAALIWWRGG